MTEFERSLRYGRKSQKMTQRELAAAAGIETSDLVSLESGKFVPLDKGTLRHLASFVGVEEHMFLSMYRSAFRQELKSTAPVSSPKNTPTPSAESFPSDLVALMKTITGMPADVRKELTSTIQLLVQAQVIRQNASKPG